MLLSSLEKLDSRCCSAHGSEMLAKLILLRKCVLRLGPEGSCQRLSLSES